MDEGFEAAALGFRFIMAFVFLSAAIPKLLAPAHFALAVRNYRLLPPRLCDSSKAATSQRQSALFLGSLWKPAQSTGSRSSNRDRSCQGSGRLAT